MKKLRTIMIVFALILTLSIVYAATTGSWDITGSGTLTGIDVALDCAGTFEEADLVTGTSSEGKWENEHTISFTFVDPGDKLAFRFKLINSSATNLEVTRITIKEAGDSKAGNFEALEFSADIGTTTNIAFDGSNGELESIFVGDENPVVAKGATGVVCAIVVEWLGIAATSEGKVSFDISIEYAVSATI